jgi:hypothetical protein
VVHKLQEGLDAIKMGTLNKLSIYRAKAHKARKR